MNPKSLNAVYKQIKNNPDTSSKDYIFKTFRKDIPALSDVEKEFICDEFTLKKNSELETYYNLNETSNEKEEFIKNNFKIWRNKIRHKMSKIFIMFNRYR